MIGQNGRAGGQTLAPLPLVSCQRGIMVACLTHRMEVQADSPKGRVPDRLHWLAAMDLHTPKVTGPGRQARALSGSHHSTGQYQCGRVGTRQAQVFYAMPRE
jgi:hypothetical protein